VKEGQPSSTARLVTEGVLLVAHEPFARSIVSDEAAEFAADFAKSWGRGKFFFKLFSWSAFRKAIFAIERVIVPGISLHYAVRKKYIEDTVSKTIAQGVQQVVVLGAGFDTLALRLSARFGRVSFVEIDHPATQYLKLRALKGKRTLPGNLAFYSSDLSNCDLAKVLSQTKCDPTLATLYIAEGLLMYFPPDRVKHLFKELATYSQSSSQVIFSFMERQRNGRIGFRSLLWLVDLWLRTRSEPFTWGMTQDEASQFLTDRGWKLVELADDVVFRDRYLKHVGHWSMPLAKGEIFCFARTEASS
jgi:methyltransferase (TIGR00027 family)